MQSLYPMHESPRCGAKTRSGSPCQSPAMPNGRCRMHGGSSLGTPKGKRNGSYRHGRFTNDAIAMRQTMRTWVKRCGRSPRPWAGVAFGRPLPLGSPVRRALYARSTGQPTPPPRPALCLHSSTQFWGNGWDVFEHACRPGTQVMVMPLKNWSRLRSVSFV